MMIRMLILSAMCLVPLFSVVAQDAAKTENTPVTKASAVTPTAPKKPEVLPTREALLVQQESDFFVGKNDGKN